MPGHLGAVVEARLDILVMVEMRGIVRAVLVLAAVVVVVLVELNLVEVAQAAVALVYLDKEAMEQEGAFRPQEVVVLEELLGKGYFFALQVMEVVMAAADQVLHIARLPARTLLTVPFA